MGHAIGRTDGQSAYIGQKEHVIRIIGNERTFEKSSQSLQYLVVISLQLRLEVWGGTHGNGDKHKRRP